MTQTVLYMGREPMRLEDTSETPTLQFRFAIVNLRELDAAPLLESPDWVDNVLALLAMGSPGSGGGAASDPRVEGCGAGVGGGRIDATFRHTGDSGTGYPQGSGAGSRTR